MRSNRFVAAILLLAAFFAFGFAYSDPSAVYADQAAAKKAYVCPPCSCGQDNEVFDKPGTCPACGMALVEKGSPASRPAPQSDLQRKRVAILIFDGVQIIDYTGPWEVFGQAGFEVFTVAQKPDPITTTFGMKVTLTRTFADAPKPDILLVPGGNVRAAQTDPQTLKWIQEAADKAEAVLSVCNGAYILAKAGLLNGLTATTTAPLIDGLAAAAPNIKVIYDKRYVDNGKVITTGGLSAGIDGSLHLVSKLFGRGRAQAIALGMEYDWQPDPGFARAALADKRVRFALDGLNRVPLNNEGGTDRWESLYLIKGVSSMAEALDRINKTVATAGKWVRQDSAAAGGATSRWTFTDEEGKTWKGAISLQPAIGDKDRFLASLKIARSDAKATAAASPADPNQLVIKDAWIQEGPPAQNTVAAFLVIENQGAADVALLSAKADAAKAVELHKMETSGEVMRMRRLDLIPVPRAGRAELQPSGLHLMLIGVNRPLKQGDEVSVTLQFSNSTQKTFRVPVKKRELAAN